MVHRKFTQRLASTALAAAVLAAVAAPSLAQPGPGAGPGPAAMAEQGAPQAQRPDRGERPRMRHMTPEQRQQFMAQRAEAFKQKLQLTPAQEPAWNQLLQTMQAGADKRHARLDDRQGMEQLTTPERIDRMRALRAQRAADADRRGDAVKAFYATLTPAQQKTFDAEGARMYGYGHRMGGYKGDRMGDHWGGMHGMRHQGPGPMAAPATK